MWPNPQETADLVTFIEEILNGKLHFLWSGKPCENGCKKFSKLYLMLVMWLEKHMALRIRNSHCKPAPFLVWCTEVFCRWRHNVFNCHKTSHNHLIEGPYKFMGGSSLQYVTSLIGLVAISIVLVEKLYFWFVM